MFIPNHLGCSPLIKALRLTVGSKKCRDAELVTELRIQDGVLSPVTLRHPEAPGTRQKNRKPRGWGEAMEVCTLNMT